MKKRQKVKWRDQIKPLTNTDVSALQVYYEAIKNNIFINPVNYFSRIWTQKIG
jgi:hypothetical protein